MSQNRAQDLLNQLKSSQRARGRRRPDPLGCYTVLLGFVFALVALAYIYLSFFLNNILRASGQGAGSLFANLMTWLHAPLGLIFGWLMAGLAVCVLLTLWLKGQRIAAVLVTAIVAIYWIAGTFRFVQGKAMPDVLVRTFMAFGLSQTASQRAVPSLIVFALATGVVGLPLLWFLRPLEGSIAKLMGIIWLLLWPILTF